MQWAGDKILAEGKFVEFRERCVIDKDGKAHRWEMVTRKNATKAVVIAAVKVDEDERRLVVIREFRVPLNDYEWGLPAGLIDAGEDAEKAAVRELKEETGLDTLEVMEVSPAIYSSAGLTDESVHMAYIAAGGTPSKIGNEASEDIETHLMTQDEVKKIISDKSLKFGAKAWFVMNTFAKTGDII